MNQFELTLKYPSLTIEHGYLFKIANLYNIDLSEANLKAWGRGRFGAIESDINLDICGLIHDHTVKSKKISIIEFIKDGLYNWGFESAEIKQALSKIQGIKSKEPFHCLKCQVKINSNEYFHRARLCYNCELKEEQK